MKQLIILMIFCTHALFWAQENVSGQIIDQRDGRPLRAVIIKTKDARQLATSDSKGNFSFTTTAKVLEISFNKKGYSVYTTTLNLPVTEPVKILLSDSVTDIEEVTLSTGYQRLPKERSTGAFSSVNKNQVEAQVGTGIIDRIANTANGVSIERGTSGEPQLMVRGISTINGPKAPLIIVDDFPYEGSISTINPNIVDNVTVLKDAAASSIWGARAANGVIVITTKKGKANASVQGELLISTTFAGKPDLSNIPAMSSSDFIDVERELFNRGFYESEINSPAHPVLSPVVDLLNQQKNGLITSAELEKQLNHFKTVDAKQQFRKYMYQPMANQQYFLNLSGGAGQHSWIGSLGYDNNTGNLGETYTRKTVRLQNRWKPGERLSVVFGGQYTDSESSSGKTGYGNIVTKYSTTVPYLELADALSNPLAASKTYSQQYKNLLNNSKLMDWNYYPLTDWQYDRSESKLREIILNFGVNYRIVKGLDADVKYQYQRQQADDLNNHSKDSYYARNYVNSFAQITSDQDVKLVVPKGGIRDYYLSTNEVNNLRGQLNYNQSWGKHSFSALAGSEVREAVINSRSQRYYGVDENNLNTGAVDYVNPYPNLITGFSDYIQKSESIGGRNTRFVSLFANGAYIFDQKYILSGSIRRDASNLFGLQTNDQWNPFWSAGAAWELGKEPFFPLGFIASMKIRGSYGFNGNIDPAMVAVSTIAYDSDYSVYTGSSTARFDNYYNPRLRWETSGMLNVGIDFASRNNRLSGSVDYFRKRGKDLFGPQMLDYTTGISYMLTNIAETESNGFDINLTGQIINSGLKWQSVLNLSTFKDKVVSYYLQDPFASQFIGNGSTVPISGVEGLPVYSIFAYRWGGLNPETGNPVGYLNGERSENYNAIVGSGTKVEDLEYFGSAIPTVYGSFINTFTYKNFSMDVAVLYKLGYWFRRTSINYSQLYDGWIGHRDFAERWQKPGDEDFTNVPSSSWVSNYNRDAFYNGSSILVEKGDHIRLQYITLNYRLKTASFFARNQSLQEVNLFLNLSNLGILWRANKKGIDPDYHFSSNMIRQPAMITIGLRAKF